jgi:hypothetical protein
LGDLAEESIDAVCEEDVGALTIAHFLNFLNYSKRDANICINRGADVKKFLFFTIVCSIVVV